MSMMCIFFFWIKWEQKHRVSDTCINIDYYAMQMLSSLWRLHWIQIDTTQKRVTKRKNRFQKESVENADFYKPVLNKIMTIHE